MADGRPNGDIVARVTKEFDFGAFYNLASNILDGDADSMGALQLLRTNWEQKFGRIVTPTTLKPVSKHIAIPFSEGVRPARVLRPPRQLLSI
ncbi:UNVERIFIED_CONTAM: hypothetical protein Sradi_6110900 [Sesamum radiatum]|uniref:Uncharacterized protein n=1 Tax=Sesamum radiatum TaxID=300843 RepID=A0AAW2KL57_SESRA